MSCMVDTKLIYNIISCSVNVHVGMISRGLVLKMVIGSLMKEDVIVA